MDRRRAIASLAALCGTLSLPSSAQDKGKTWRIGFLGARSRPASLESNRIGALPRELRKLGYVEGRNLQIEWRFGDSNLERVAAFAAELASMKLDVIVTGSDVATTAVQRATTTIPIVMGNSDDPVSSGFVKELARPGNNITGLSNMFSELGPKQLEILRGAVRGLSSVGVLAYADYAAAARIVKNVERAARAVRIAIVPVEVREASAIDDAFKRMSDARTKAVIVTPHPTLNSHVRETAEAALRYRLPSIASIREFADAGGLIAYGQNLSENYRHAALYVDKILRGALPAELPVQLPTKLELIVNRRTERALGMKLPKELLLRADSVLD